MSTESQVRDALIEAQRRRMAELPEPRPYSLDDFAPYREAKAKLEELQAKRATALDELRARASQAAQEAARLEQEAVEQDAEDLRAGREPDPARWRAVDRAREVARKAEAALRDAERRRAAIDLAIRRQQEEVARLEAEARVAVAETARADHERAVRRLVKALREVSEAFREERAVVMGATRVLGSYSGLYTGLPPLDPDSLLRRRPLEEWVKALQEQGYAVDDDKEEGGELAAAS